MLDIESDSDELRVFLAIGKIIIGKKDIPLATFEDLTEHFLGSYTEDQINQILKTLTLRELVAKKEINGVKGFIYESSSIDDIQEYVDPKVKTVE